METRRLGNSDLELTVVGLGCWLMGRDMWHNVDDEESVRAIYAALDAGVNWLDTAEAYGDGYSESLIGEALSARPREEVLIATKVAPNNLAKEVVPQRLEASLKRLQTDYVDLYQIHWPNPDIPLAQTMEALLTEQQKGRIRYLGVSNFNTEQLAEALQYGEIVSLQPPYNLSWRYLEKDIIPFREAHNIGIIPYSPMAQGLLTGKFSLENRPPAEDNRSRNRLFLEPTYDIALQQVEVVKSVAEKHGKTPAQVALRWVLQQPGIIAAIVGARTEKHIQDNVGAAGWELASEDVDCLTAASDEVMAALPAEYPGSPWKWD